MLWANKILTLKLLQLQQKLAGTHPFVTSSEGNGLQFADIHYSVY